MLIQKLLEIMNFLPTRSFSLYSFTQLKHPDERHPAHCTLIFPAVHYMNPKQITELEAATLFATIFTNFRTLRVFNDLLRKYSRKDAIKRAIDVLSLFCGKLYFHKVCSKIFNRFLKILPAFSPFVAFRKPTQGPVSKISLDLRDPAGVGCV